MTQIRCKACKVEVVPGDVGRPPQTFADALCWATSHMRDRHEFAFNQILAKADRRRRDAGIREFSHAAYLVYQEVIGERFEEIPEMAEVQ